MKYLLCILLMLFSYALFSQNYTFKSDHKPFGFLDSYDTISTKNWDEPLTKIPINFNFTLINSIYDSLYVGDGYLGFDCIFIGNLSTCSKYIDVFNNDFIDRYRDNKRAESFILIRNEDSLIIEFQNVGFFDEFYEKNTLDDSLTVQVILKSDNSITIHIGPNLVKKEDENIVYSGMKGGYFGIWNKLDHSESYLLTGDANSPQLSTGDIDVTVDGTPVEGMVYQFNLKNSSINKLDNKGIDIGCYQIGDNIYIKNLSNSPVNTYFFDIRGREVNHINKILPEEIVLAHKSNFKSNLVVIKCVSEYEVLIKKYIIY